MSRLTALECILQEWGYSSNKAQRLGKVIDEAGIPGLSADDLASAFFRWRDVQLHMVIKTLPDGDIVVIDEELERKCGELLDRAFLDGYGERDGQMSLYAKTFGKKAYTDD